MGKKSESKGDLQGWTVSLKSLYTYTICPSGPLTWVLSVASKKPPWEEVVLKYNFHFNRNTH